MSKLIQALDQASLRTDVPTFRPGDSVKVHVKVVEGNRSRLQVFAGVKAGWAPSERRRGRQRAFIAARRRSYAPPGSLVGADQASRRSLILAALPRRLRR